MITFDIQALLAMYGTTDLLSDVNEDDDINDKIGALTDSAADTASTATIIALLRQVAEAVNNGTGAAIGSNLSLVDLLGAFDGAADTEGDIFLALGIADVASSAAKASVVALIRQALADIAVIDGVAGNLTDAAADTATTATMMALLRQIAEAVNNGTGTALGSNLSLVDILGAFDGSADPQGDIYQALGVSATKSVKDLIDDLDAVVDGVETKIDTIDGNVDDIEGVVGTLADTADHTAGTATAMKLIRWLDQNLGAFDGAADTEGNIFLALGIADVASVAAKASVVALIRQALADIADVEGKVDGLEAPVGTLADIADETASTATVMNMLRALLDNRAGPRVVYKTVAFAGGVGTGAVGTVALFTVTGSVKVQIEATCTESLAEAAPGSATICLGYTGTTNAFIAATNALDLDAGDLWFDSTPTETIKDTATAQLAKTSIGNGTDILAEIATADINDGTIVFRCEWEPLLPSGAGLVVAA